MTREEKIKRIFEAWDIHELIDMQVLAARAERGRSDRLRIRLVNHRRRHFNRNATQTRARRNPFGYPTYAAFIITFDSPERADSNTIRTLTSLPYPH
jgi:hypothetical protein